MSFPVRSFALSIALVLSPFLGPAALAQQANLVVAENGQATTGDPVDCSGSGTTDVFESVQAAVAEANTDADQDAIYVCPGTYGPDENITITEPVTITGAGPGQVTVNAVTGGGQDPALLLAGNESGAGGQTADIRELTLAHDGSGNPSTIAIEQGVKSTTIENVTITRGSLGNASSAIRFGDGSVTVKNCDVTGGPIGSGGALSGNYTVKNNTLRAAGDEELWLTEAGTLVMTGNTVETTGDTDDDKLGVAIYNVQDRLVFENNTITATRSPLLLGTGIPLEVSGQTFDPLSTEAGMQALLRNNEINGGTAGQHTFVSKENGDLRVETGNASGNNTGVFVVRSSFKNTTSLAGTDAYGRSTLEVASSGNVIHVGDGSSASDSPVFQEDVALAERLGLDTPGETSLRSITVADGVTAELSGAVSVTSSLTLGDGSTLRGHPIVLADGASLTDNGLASGSIRATRTVGDGERVSFGGIGLTLTEEGGPNAPGETTVTRTDGDPVTKGAGSIERYYDVSAENSTLSVDLTIEYDDDELDGISESALALFRSDDQGGSWAQIGTASANQQANTLTNEGLSSFSRFTAAADGATLPVELAEFEATTDGGAVRLRWRTASETNNAGFRIQHKTEGGYETLTFVDGAGTSTQSTTYTHRVADLDPGAHTFRLQQVDQDGTTHRSDPVSVTLGLKGQYEVSRVAPNPVATRSEVEVAVQRPQDVTVALYDALGRRVTTLHTGTMASKTTHRLGLDTQGLSSGTYFLRVRGEDFRATRRVVVVR